MNRTRRRPGRPFVPADLAVIALVAAVTAGVSAYSYADGGTGRVSIASGKNEWIYPLNVDREIDVRGPLGDTRVEIADGTARIVDSPCRDKVCVRMGRLDRTGDWSACLPNGVLVRIVGGGSDEVDAATY